LDFPLKENKAGKYFAAKTTAIKIQEIRNSLFMNSLRACCIFYSLNEKNRAKIRIKVQS
jgi:hypothetical protein